MLLKFNFTTQVIVHEMRRRNKRLWKIWIENNSSGPVAATITTTTTIDRARHWHIHCTLTGVLFLASHLHQKTYIWKKKNNYFSGSTGQQACMTWIPFYNRLSLFLNFTRNEFGNGTSTVVHDFQFRLFQVIRNCTSCCCCFPCSILFVSYHIISHAIKPILQPQRNVSTITNIDPCSRRWKIQLPALVDSFIFFSTLFKRNNFALFIAW